ncbi:SusC/RagA family TonB-linked outer membrane protein [soil metagenome]
MRKKITLFALLCVFLCMQSFAQDRTLTGKVTSSEDNMGIPGVSVVVVGTTTGTTTDIDGNYQLKVSTDAKQLRFSGVGLKAQTTDIGTSDNLSISMLNEVSKLNEVVVTALGVRREEKSLGYSTQQVTGDEVSTSRETNFINSLQGKVAGVQITGSSNLGGSSRILLRGIRSINYENQPLFVVDGIPFNNGNFGTVDQRRGALGYDYGNAAQDINPDDIESINVLKGSAASALYGARGANGVILVTTKKGVARAKGEGKLPIGISLTTGIQFSSVSVLPEYQDRYGGGASSDFVPSDIHPGEERSNFEYDGSWGPEMNGQQVYQWDSYYPSLPNYNKKTAWSAHPDNVKDFFETGMEYNNTIAIDGGNENTLYRLSYTNLNQKGTIPNSSLNRNVLSFNGSNRFTKKLTSTMGINIVRQNGKGRAQTGYNSLASNFTQWWERQIDMEQLKDYKNPDGSQRTWNMNSETDLSPLYWDNPYWTCYENYEIDTRDRLYGFANVAYELWKDISVIGTVKTDRYNDIRKERTAIGGSSISKYSEENINFYENNYEVMLTAKKSLTKDIDFNGILGVNRQDTRTVDNYGSTQGGLKVPNYYSLNNSVDAITSTTTDIPVPITQLRRNSMYGSLSFGFQRFLYLDLTGRNDWSSTLPVENSSYFYPSAAMSFVFSELTKLKWLSFGKLRFGWAQTAIDPPAYVADVTRPQVTDNFVGYATAIIPNQANNADLKPERTASWEPGVEVSLFNGRIGFDVTYYNSVSSDVIFRVQQSSATGYASKYYNAAEISNKGWEIHLEGIPVSTKSGLQWGLGVNWAQNHNKVEKLFVDENGKATTSVLLQNAPFSATFQARPDMACFQIVGYDYAYDQNGNHIIDGGAYARTSTVRPLGSVLPQYTGGFTTFVSWKSVKLAGVVDFQKGGKVFSMSNMWGKYSGTLAETAEGDIRENGLVLEGVNQSGVDANGEPVTDGTPNTTNIAAVDHFFLDGGYIITAADVYDASFIKLREISLGIGLPEKWLKKSAIQGVTISFIGRNLAILDKNVPNIDPEAGLSTSNIQGLEGGQLPTVRTFGASISVRF